MTPPRPDEQTHDGHQSRPGDERQPASDKMVDEEAEETMPASDPPADY